MMHRPQNRNLLSRNGALIFATAAVTAFLFSAEAADFDTYFIEKGLVYSQTDTGTPQGQLSNGFIFRGEVDATTSNFVTSVVMVSPTIQAWPIPVDSTGTQFKLKKKYNTQTTLGTTFPNGAYTFTNVTLHDGSRVLKLALPGDAFPNAPRMGNWSSFQSIDTGRNLQATWDPLVGGTVNDFIQFRIEDLQGNKIFKSPGFGKPGALDGTARGYIVPARALNSSQTYNGILTFERISMTNQSAYPGALGYSGYYTETQFPIQTSFTSSSSDVQSFSISKTQRYTQTNASLATLDSTTGFRFEAKAQQQATNDMTSASILLPNSLSQDLPLSSDGVTYDLQVDFPTKNAMDSGFPNGTYGFTLNTVHEGVLKTSMPLLGDRYPGVPHVANFGATQQFQASQDLIVNWDAWPGGGPNDFVQLRIQDPAGNKVYATPNFGKKGALDGTATSATVPGGTLIPGVSYQGTVLFESFIAIDNTSFDAAGGTSSYVTRTKFPMVTAPPDVKLYELSKSQAFEQKGTNVPILLTTGNPFTFESSALSSTAGSISAATIKIPSGQTKTLVTLADGSGLSYVDLAAAKSGFDISYPSGIYTFNITTSHDGVKNLALPLQGDVYPPAPRVANFSQAQSLDPTTDFILAWQSWAQGTTNDFVQLQVVDAGGNVIFQTKGIGKKTALDGTATSITIPRNTLVRGVPYRGNLEFRKIVTSDSTTYLGSTGLAGYSSRTQFSLGASVAGAILSGVQVLADGSFQFQLMAAPGRSYRVDTSTNLTTWQAGATNTISSPPVNLVFPITTGLKAQFYRVELLP